MFELFFYLLNRVASFIWSLPAAVLITVAGLYFGIVSRFFQLRKFPAICKTFFEFASKKEHDERGVHPLKVFFASLGGAIGMGNVIVIAEAVQIGGPGALFWTWVTGFVGMLLKYGEVYLGMRYRVKNDAGGYDGGPMYFLPKAFKAGWIPILVSVLFCVYGAEIFAFSELTSSISVNWGISRTVVMVVLLAMVLFAGLGGVKRVGEISGAIVPIFVVLYVLMSLWVVATNITVIPELLAVVFKSAFTGHASVGAFAGATWLMSLGTGSAAGCYSGDVGIGYASVIHSESATTRPGRQASLAIFGIFLDTFVVCSISIFLVLVTGVWQEPIASGRMVQVALSHYFPHMQLFMPFFLFLLGYSTIIAYFVFGLKSARYLSPKYGKLIYTLYTATVMILFSFFDSFQAFTVMTFCGAMLLLINVSATLKLRHDIRFELEQ